MSWPCPTCGTMNPEQDHCIVCGTSAGTDAPTITQPIVPIATHVPAESPTEPPAAPAGPDLQRIPVAAAASGGDDGSKRPGWIIPLVAAVVVVLAVGVGVATALLTGRSGGDDVSVEVDDGDRNRETARPIRNDTPETTTSTSEPETVETTTTAAPPPPPPPTVAPTAPPTVPPTEPAAVDSYGEDQVRSTAAGDWGRVAALDGWWVPQLSSKKVGVAVDGIMYGYEEILDDHHAMNSVAYGNALLLSSDDVGSYSGGDFWVTIVDEGYSDAEGALAWCAREGLTHRDQCIAKQIRLEGPSEDTTRYP